MRTGLAPLIIFSLRRLERLLPVRALYWAIKPFALTRSPASTVPDYFTEARREGKRSWVNPRSLVNQAIEFLEDRLASPKWQRRCRINGPGLDVLQKAWKAGRPVVLTFVHFGPFTLLPCWLRSAGIPLIALRIGKAETRSERNRMKDQLSPFPAIPTVLYLDQLREVVEVLSAGNVVLIAIDHPAGKQVEVPLDNGWTFRLAMGAIRLASRYQAELIPCCIVEEGGWNFRIEFGRPVPAEFLAGEPDVARAGKHLLMEMFPHIQSHLEQCRPSFFQCFDRRAAKISPEKSPA